MLTVSQNTKIDHVDWQTPISLGTVIWYLRHYLSFRSGDSIDHLSIEVNESDVQVLSDGVSWQLPEIRRRLS